MSEQVQELLNIPQEFLRDGMQFVNRSQKRMHSLFSLILSVSTPWIVFLFAQKMNADHKQPTSASSSKSARPLAPDS
jgi:hypothetical protein